MPYNHRQWNIDSDALGRNLEEIARICDATLPYLNAVQAGRTQVAGTIALSDEGKRLARAGDDLQDRWNKAFADVNRAIASTRGDRAEDRRYAQ